MFAEICIKFDIEIHAEFISHNMSRYLLSIITTETLVISMQIHVYISDYERHTVNKV